MDCAIDADGSIILVMDEWVGECTVRFWKRRSSNTHRHSHFTAVGFCLGQRTSAGTKRNSPTHTCRGHQSSLICFPHLLQSMASSLFNLLAWQSFSTISVQVFFSLPLGLAPSTSYSIHFFTQSLSSFHCTCPYLCNMFCCSTEIMLSNPSLLTLYLKLHLVA